MKDTKNQESGREVQTLLEKLEQATPKQVAQSLIAQIVLKIKNKKKA